ncbi:enolase-phosphatase E1-like isoform X2 [Limulus polyphemus]|uniref:Enolase-phosphatase E1-like isoform X2 n=1 Tax=Limulus polyphemus TaxID=6850 RepID=A0ABM1B0X7_LIMPO|nr:enolase-phosphatase E1-like isoform X2 [Limulus polyphemus]
MATMITMAVGSNTSLQDVLFPYIRQNLIRYVKDHWKNAELIKDIDSLRMQAVEDLKNGLNVVQIPDIDEEEDRLQEAIITNVFDQMDADRKTTALKQLQGHIWREAYHSGKIEGHVYEDVMPALKSWKTAGKHVYIYSSGSVEAQKLLFGATTYGNLLQFIDGHFDTNIGPKKESTSYTKIANECGYQAHQILFLTDIPEESQAAKNAGMKTTLVSREGNKSLCEEVVKEFGEVKSFDQISLL